MQLLKDALQKSKSFASGKIPTFAQSEAKLLETSRAAIDIPNFGELKLLDYSSDWEFFASPLRWDFLRKLTRNKQEQWSFDDWLYLFSCASTTIGDDKTILYVLPRICSLAQDRGFWANSGVASYLVHSKLTYLDWSILKPKHAQSLAALGGYYAVAEILYWFEVTLEESGADYAYYYEPNASQLELLEFAETKNWLY